MKDIQEFFKLGMKRDIPEFYEPECDDVQCAINLGSGASIIPGAINFDFPEWDADRMPIPRDDESVSEIHAYHFLEHLLNPIGVLREMQRVLAPGGVANIVVPHYLGSMAYHDFGHMRICANDIFSNLLNQPYYSKDREGWKFREHVTFGMFLVERNIAIFTQLVKMP